MAKLYWIHTKEMDDPYTDGYIGITKRSPETRLKEHLGKHDHITEECNLAVLHEGTVEEMSELEEYYRPESNIGWNRSPGGLTGGRPIGIHTSGWTHSEESRRKRSESLLGENNPMYGRTTSDKQRAAVSKAMKGKKKDYKVTSNWPTMHGSDNPRARKVYAEGVIYDTVKACTEAHAFKNHNNVRYRCKSDKWPDWYYD